MVAAPAPPSPPFEPRARGHSLALRVHGFARARSGLRLTNRGASVSGRVTAPDGDRLPVATAVDGPASAGRSRRPLLAGGAWPSTLARWRTCRAGSTHSPSRWRTCRSPWSTRASRTARGPRTGKLAGACGSRRQEYPAHRAGVGVGRPGRGVRRALGIVERLRVTRGLEGPRRGLCAPGPRKARCLYFGGGGFAVRRPRRLSLRPFQHRLHRAQHRLRVIHRGTCGNLPSDAGCISVGDSDRSAVAGRRSNLGDVRGPLLHPARARRG
jgi:hypothetical protein